MEGERKRRQGRRIGWIRERDERRKIEGEYKKIKKKRKMRRIEKME